MKYDLGLNNKLNFDKVDLTPANKVVEEIAEELKSETRGLVECQVKPYIGEITNSKKTVWNYWWRIGLGISA